VEVGTSVGVEVDVGVKVGSTVFVAVGSSVGKLACVGVEVALPHAVSKTTINRLQKNR
jgi:hypothetical protein